MQHDSQRIRGSPATLGIVGDQELLSQTPSFGPVMRGVSSEQTGWEGRETNCPFSWLPSLWLFHA